MKLILIAALNKKRVIGKEGAIPWHIPEDLQRFKKLTIHHTVLMGRKTFESIGQALPDRRNVVISSRAVPGIETYPSPEAALEALHNEEKVFVIGGGEVFRHTIGKADEILLTIMDNDEDGDTFFPPYEELLRSKFILSTKTDQQLFQFLDFVRK